ncbi:MAG: DNA primase [Selenomonadaceae bacterium]|nr:DNA primase [Selenomonadaceae bacterium]
MPNADNAKLDEFVNRVREGSDIFSVASHYLNLIQKGGRYWACCPFHHEKTPSFTIDPVKGFYHCFGCGEGGNVFNFVARMEGISYFDAVKLQAKRLNIPLPNARPKSDRELELERVEKSLYDINELARNFFHNCLTMTNYGESALAYLDARGITAKTIEEFKLGYAPDDWDKLSTAFEKRGVTQKQLIDAGLAAARNRGSGVYDRFRNRIMIPITDVTGHVLAFGGRILETPSNLRVVGGNAKPAPKYLNTPETIIFNKRKVLFGLDRAVSSINREGFVIVVEGYMDAISLVSAGVTNVVATLGTAFTEDHIKILKRYSKKIVFCYDSDEAGQNATMRALPIVTAAEAQASVIIIPDGKDPDDYVRKHGRDEFWQLALNAMPMIDYRIRYVMGRADKSSVDGRINALREILSSIATMNDSALRNEYSRKLALMLSLDPNTVNDEWKKFSRVQMNTPSPTSDRVVKLKTTRTEAGNDAMWRACRAIIQTGWHATDLLQHALTSVSKENFPQTHREIIDYLEKCISEDRRPDDVSAAEQLSPQALTELSECLTDSGEELTAEEVQAYMDSLALLKIEELSRQYRQAAQELEQLEIGSPEHHAKLLEVRDIKRRLDRKRS